MTMTSFSMPSRPGAVSEPRLTRIGEAVAKAFARLVEARAETADRVVSSQLAAKSDGVLTGFGFSAGEIAELRAGASVNRIMARR